MPKKKPTHPHDVKPTAGKPLDPIGTGTLYRRAGGNHANKSADRMSEQQPDDPFERILTASNRPHLDNPFRTSSDLRRKHFPGVGGDLSHARLVKAYVAEMADPSPDWQLLAHGTWPWLIGHAHDLANLAADLEAVASSGDPAIPAAKRGQYVEQYSEAGTQEIEVFYRIFAAAGDDFRKAVLAKLAENPPPPEPAAPAAPAQPIAPRPRPEPPAEKPSVDDLDPITRAKMAFIGTAFFFVLSLIPLGIQFWRQPDEDHWIVVGISGFLAFLTLVFLIDYLRKKP